MKIKYSLEYKFASNHKVVDPIHSASFQAPISIDGSTTTINLDLSIGNYFIIDLEDNAHSTRNSITINPINANNVQRFEILFIEPIGVRRFTGSNLLFPDYFLTNMNTVYDADADYRFVFRGGNRRLLLVSAKKIQDTTNYVCQCTPWFDSEIVSVPIAFTITDLADGATGTITIKTDGITFVEENIELPFFNGFNILKPRGYKYNYTITVPNNPTLTGSITAADTTNLDYIVVVRQYI